MQIDSIAGINSLTFVKKKKKKKSRILYACYMTARVKQEEGEGEGKTGGDCCISDLVQHFHCLMRHPRLFQNFLPLNQKIGMFISRQLLCSYMVASLCCQSLAKPAAEPLSMLDVEFYIPTGEVMAKVHAKFISSLKETGAGSVLPPVLPKVISLANASSHDLSQARDLVDEAIKQQGEYNLWRVANPRQGNERNPTAAQSRRDTGSPPSPPRLTSELLKALKLTNDVDTQDLRKNGTLQRYQNEAKIRIQDLRPPVGSSAGSASLRRADRWDGSDWMADQDHSLSQQPFHSKDSYKVPIKAVSQIT